MPGGQTMVLTPADHAETGGMPPSAIGYDGPIDFEGSVACSVSPAMN
jgi:hypothetical protein